MREKIENFLDIVLTSAIIGVIAGVILSILVKPFLDILVKIDFLQVEASYVQLAIIFGIIGFIDTIPKVIKFLKEA